MRPERIAHWFVVAMARRRERLAFQPALDPDQELMKIDGFLNTIENALADCFASVSDVSHSGHHHHHRIRRHRIDESAQLEPRSAGQVNVSEDQVEFPGSDQPHRFFGSRCREARKFGSEEGQERLTRVIIIFNDEYRDSFPFHAYS